MNFASITLNNELEEYSDHLVECSFKGPMESLTFRYGNYLVFIDKTREVKGTANIWISLKVMDNGLHDWDNNPFYNDATMSTNDEDMVSHVLENIRDYASF